MPRITHPTSLNYVLAFVALAASLMVCAVAAHASCTTPSFAAAPLYSLPRRPLSVATGDFNGDGKADLVLGNDGPNQVYVMLSDGAEGFLPPVAFTTGGSPASVAVADFNNDARADIVTANNTTGTTSVLLGDGNGGFGAAMTVSAGNTGFSFVAVGHFDNDLNLDLAVSHTNGNIGILLGNGFGGFYGPTVFTVGERIRSIAVGDFNIDGKQDLAVVRQFSDQVYVLFGDGMGGFAPAIGFTAGTEPTSVVARDFNNDGKADLAVALYASRLIVLLNNGDGSFGTATTYTVAGNVFSTVLAADFNNDGNSDLAVGHNSGVSIRFGNGTGVFGAQTNVTSIYGPTALAVDDFNSDGSADLAVASYSSGGVAVLKNDGAGSFLTAPRYSTNGDANSVLSADFNKDGKLDLAVANRNANTVSVYLGSGAGAFGVAKVFSVGAPPTSNATNGPFSLAAGDFNNDSLTDLVTANFTGGGVSILLGDGAGNFPTANKIGTGSAYPWYVAVGDFDTDGKADLALTRNNYFNTISVLFGNGNGTFGAPVDFSTVSGPEPIAIGDLNGDGKPDLAVGNAFGGQIAVHLNNGSGGFGGATVYQTDVNAGATSILIGDYTGDGKPDLVVSNDVKDTISLFTGNGSGAFSAPVFFSVGDSPSDLTAGDFNGDGLPDVAVVYTNLGSVSVLLGNGLGSFASPRNYSAGSPSDSITAGDFNGDGRVDLATDGINVFINSCDNAASVALPRLEINDISLSELPSAAVFSVILYTPSSQTVTVQFQTIGQSAVSGVDFQLTSGTLTFAPGETAQSISVPIINDSINEFRESFAVNLHHPVNATIKKRQGVARITDNDPEPTIAIAGTNVVEGSSGTTPANFNLALSSPSGKLITLTYSTADGTATAGSDYQSASNRVVSIPSGASSATASIAVNGDLENEANETFFVNFSNPVNVSVSNAQATGTITNDDATNLQLNQASYVIGEGDGHIAIQVVRADSTAPATVNYTTSDTFSISQNCQNVNTGIASSRCDYATTVGTLRFASGEGSKTIIIPIIDDNISEGNETFTITLSNPTGGILGSSSSAPVNIAENPNTAGNPIDTVPFFVLLQYIDFLGRLPDQGGYQGWQGILNNCPQSGKDANGNYCDRIEVSAGFYRSEEFQSRGYFIYRFYSAVGKIPLYEQFMPDFAQVSGFLSTQQLEDNKVAFIQEFMTRPVFQNLYGSTTTPTAYVDALLSTVGLPNHPTRSTWIAGLTNQTLTRAQVLRQLVESTEVFQKYYNEAFVIMQYFGYLRRSADISYLQWIQTMNSTNGDYRVMINGFMNSDEYRKRFGN